MLDALAVETLTLFEDGDFAHLSPGERIAVIGERMPDTVFTTSLGIEDQVITFLIARHAPHLKVVTLDTGRLFAETVALIGQTEAATGLTIDVRKPAQKDVDDFVARFGVNGFYDSVEARHACCHIRKVKLLNAALDGAGGWITGLRREQSGNRSDVSFVEWDRLRQLVKFNPLADVTKEHLTALVDARAIPVNPLHARGYPSIGCEPCTRAVKPGEDERAGRWWWEQDRKAECGLHVVES